MFSLPATRARVACGKHNSEAMDLISQKVEKPGIWFPYFGSASPMKRRHCLYGYCFLAKRKNTQVQAERTAMADIMREDVGETGTNKSGDK